MLFKNGGYMTRDTAFSGHGGDININGNAIVTCQGANSGISFNVVTTQSLLLNTTTGPRNAIVLKDDAYINVRRVYGYNGAGVGIEVGEEEVARGYLMVDKPNGKEYAIYNGVTVTVSRDATACITATNWSSTGTASDREVTFDGSFAGEGTVEIHNLTPQKFTVGIVKSSETFTGSLKLVKSEEETEANATKLVLGGAEPTEINWRGATLVASDGVETSPLAFVSMTFAAVDLVGNLKLKLDATGNDRLSLTGEGYKGKGRLEIVVPEGFEPEAKKEYPLGTLGKVAERPKLKAATFKLVYGEPDEVGVKTYGLKRNSGFYLVIQ